MAADDFEFNIQGLRSDREKLSELVFEPLQEIKDFVARKLRLDEVDNIVGFLQNVIRTDTLKTVTDGEALIAVLNLYYGQDNLRVLQRLLRKINCFDLLEVLNEWEASNNPVDTRAFQACGYFPLWIRIKNHFTWFTENKKAILQTLKRLFRVPEIVSCDPDYETVIFMGVSFGRSDLLVYVLVPLCTRRHIRSSLGRNDVCLTLEQLSISGVYFGRKSGKNGYDDDLSVTSFSSVNESMQGDFVGKEDRQILFSFKGPSEVKKHAHYNGTDKIQNQEGHPELHAAQSISQSGSPQGKTSRDLKVEQTRMSHIDAAPPASTEGQPIRLVRPKILYIDHSMDVQDSPMIDRAAFDGEHHENIVRESTDIVQESPQNYMFMYKEGAQHEKSNGRQNLSHEKKERIPAGEQDGLIVPQVKHRRDEDRKLTDELMEEHINHGLDWAYKSVTNNLNGRKWTDRGESENGKRQMSVMDFSVEDNKYNHNDKGGQPQSSIQTSATGTAEAEVAEGHPSTKQNLIPLKTSTFKSDGKRRYTSTATFQVNMGNKSANSKGQPIRYINDEICRPEAMTSLNMSQPGFDTKERLAAGRHSPSRQAENHYAPWYEDTAAEDYYKAMIPEPEPGNTQQLYQHEDFYRHKMAPVEETATPRHDSVRNMHSGVRTPLYTPPSSFRDPTPAGSKLVMVTTGLVDTPKQQPLIVSMDHHSIPQHGWESPRMEPNKMKQFPKTEAMPSDSFENTSEDFYFDEHGRRNPDRPDRSVNGYQQQHLTLSDYADSVFTDHDDTGRRFAEVPPPYVAPPDYKKTRRRSDDSVSTDTGTFDRGYKSPLLSAASVSSIYKEKEMFLSQEELQMSIRGAEDKEMEKQMELCKDLMIAAKGGDEEEVRRLIEEGVDVNHQNEFGQSSMMVASWEGHLGIVEALISAEADTNLQDGFGKSALHEAAVSGQHAIVHRLIPGGANINLADEEHRTPLHYAAMRGKRRIVEVLLLFGANVSLLTKTGESAIELAYLYRYDDIVTLLMSHGDKKIRKEMESQIRKQKLRQISSAASLPNLSKATSMKELSRSRSRPDLRKKKSVCSIQ